MSSDDTGTPERYPMRAIEALFNEALERPSGSARQSWLRHAVGGDEGLQREVAALLNAHETSIGFLENGALLEEDSDDANLASSGAVVGGRIGPYHLVEEIGEGGFGTVFRANQERPVRRQVALKVIKLGMDTHQVIIRFEAERQALALLDHPSIARVLDAGSTETGRPYFVMDLAPGLDLTRFCDQRQLSVRDRLGVFLDLCSAVQHAHQRGVIHRDLKPSNVLVAEVDGRVVPKVIDFGIAKATGEDLTEATLFTEHGQVIGTPVYMSPEQAAGGGDIDTRADVYSLGVILYELLTGSTPFHAEDLRERAAAGEMAAFVRDFEATAPSSRWPKNAPDTGDSARCRGASSTEIRSQVKGDLDHVVLCALANDRDRRYESAAALARDVQRVLESRPVRASPPSTIYHARKFLRRHRVLTVAALAVLMAITSGVTIAVNSLRGKRDQAIVLREVFSAATDESSGTDSIGEFAGATVAERVERRTLAAFGADDPILVDALTTFASRRRRAGDLVSALDALRRALTAAERIHGPAARETAYARAAYGMLLLRTGDRAAAGAELRTAIDTDRRQSGPRSPALNGARLALARLLATEDDRAGAIALAMEADATAQESARGDRSLRVDALELLLELRDRGDDVDATAKTWHALNAEYEAVLPANSTYLARRHIEYGQWLASAGEPESAARQLRLALDSLSAIDDAPVALEFDALRAINQIHVQEPTLANDGQSRRLLERELEAAKRRFDPSTSAYRETLVRCADAFRTRGDIGRSTRLLVERYRLYVAATGDSSWSLPGRIVLAQELAKRADAIRLQDDLGEDAYEAALEAVAIALENDRDELSYLEVQMVLQMRAGNFLQASFLATRMKESSSMEGEHPVLLAMEAMAVSRLSRRLPQARNILARARALSLEPQWATVSGLQDTIRWAERVVNGASPGSAAPKSTRD